MPGIIGNNTETDITLTPSVSWSSWVADDNGAGPGSSFYTPAEDENITKITFGGRSGAASGGLYVAIIEITANGGSLDDERELFADYTIFADNSEVKDWELDLRADPLVLPAGRTFAIYGYLGSVANGRVQYIDSGVSSIDLSGTVKKPYMEPYISSPTSNALRLWADVEAIDTTLRSPWSTENPPTDGRSFITVTSVSSDSPFFSQATGLVPGDQVSYDNLGGELVFNSDLEIISNIAPGVYTVSHSFRESTNSFLETVSANLTLTIESSEPFATLTTDKQVLLAGDTARIAARFNQDITAIPEQMVTASLGTVFEISGNIPGNLFFIDYLPPENFNGDVVITVQGFTDIDGNPVDSPSRITLESATGETQEDGDAFGKLTDGALNVTWRPSFASILNYENRFTVTDQTDIGSLSIRGRGVTPAGGSVQLGLYDVTDTAPENWQLVASTLVNFTDIEGYHSGDLNYTAPPGVELAIAMAAPSVNFSVSYDSLSEAGRSFAGVDNTVLESSYTDENISLNDVAFDLKASKAIPTPTPVPTPTPSPVPTPTPVPTPSPVPTPTPVPTPVPVITQVSQIANSGGLGTLALANPFEGSLEVRLDGKALTVNIVSTTNVEFSLPALTLYNRLVNLTVTDNNGTSDAVRLFLAAPASKQAVLVQLTDSVLFGSQVAIGDQLVIDTLDSFGNRLYLNQDLTVTLSPATPSGSYLFTVQILEGATNYTTVRSTSITVQHVQFSSGGNPVIPGVLNQLLEGVTATDERPSDYLIEMNTRLRVVQTDSDWPY